MIDQPPMGQSDDDDDDEYEVVVAADGERSLVPKDRSQIAEPLRWLFPPEGKTQF